MKQFKILLLSGMVIFFTACGGGGSGGSINNSEGTTAPSSAVADNPSTIAVDKIMAYADDPTLSAPTVEDYADAGVIGVTAENIAEINDVLTSLTKEELDTKEEIQAIANDLDITLPDTTLPMIILNGVSPTEVTEGDTYSDAGATATDDRDGTIDVLTIGSVDTSTVGAYTITYTATDNAGNTATSSRTVNVVLSEDVTPPVITLVGEDTVTVTEGNAYSEEGATAVDNRDGTVAVTTGGSVNTSVSGTYTITYTATDSAGNSITEIRIVIVESIPNIMPTANAGADKTTEINEAVIITGIGSDSDGTIQYEWKKGNTVIGTTATITYIPTAAGTDTLTLTVTDDDGSKASDSMVVTVTAEYIPHEVPEIDKTTKQAYLDAVNAARVEEQDCGVYGMMGPADPLVWNDALYQASYEHSNDMMRSNIFSHDGSNTEHDWTAVIQNLEGGSILKERIENNGYCSTFSVTYSASENIIAYKGFIGDDLSMVIEEWIKSDDHCHALMSDTYEEIGMAHVNNGSGNYTDYWTQNFGICD